MMNLWWIYDESMMNLINICGPWESIFVCVLLTSTIQHSPRPGTGPGGQPAAHAPEPLEAVALSQADLGANNSSFTEFSSEVSWEFIKMKIRSNRNPLNSGRFSGRFQVVFSGEVWAQVTKASSLHGSQLHWPCWCRRLERAVKDS